MTVMRRIVGDLERMELRVAAIQRDSSWLVTRREMSGRARA